MRHFFCDSLKRFFVACALTIVGIFSAHAATLPTGYTELQYIESNGTQAINTGVKYSGNDFVIKWRAVDTTFYSGTTLFASNGAAPFSGGLYGNRSSRPYYIGSGSALNIGYVSDDNNFHEWELTVSGQNVTLKKDGVQVGTETFRGTINTTHDIYLFCGGWKNNTDPTLTQFSSWRLGYWQLWDNGVLVRNFVPCKNASNVIGMYDTVSGQFFTNVGTGTFTAGPEVANSATSCNGTIVNYTSATGTGVQNGTPTPTNPITPTFYQQGDMVLRKVGDYADSYDATTGKITRRVGVKVLDGTEGWTTNSGTRSYGYSYRAKISNDVLPGADNKLYCTHLQPLSRCWDVATVPSCSFHQQASESWQGVLFVVVPQATVTDFKQYLAEQYAAGTPVTVYYPLATAVEEDWTETSYCATGIKIATTKYTEDAFAGLMTTLESAINKVTNIVDTTVQQATEIGNLATTKQDRPDTDCPAGRKCLLIMGADNKPHWYLIQE